MSTPDLAVPGTCLLGPGFFGRTLLYSSPRRIIFCSRAEELDASLDAVTRAQTDGFHCAGFLSYEAGQAIMGLPAARTDLPLLWFGVYDAPAPAVIAPPLAAVPLPERFDDDVDRSGYARGFAAIQDYLAAGDTYQVNYTFRSRFRLPGPAAEFFLDRFHAHPAPYAAWIDTGEYRVLSFSPELFLRRRGERLTAVPMKGTMPRGRDEAEDAANRAALAGSEKNRAENLMIVDLLRNDLGRVAEIGSVRVESLFEIERHPTVWQMVSTVTALTRADWSAIVHAAFPCGSVTGAPKRRTMEIIREVEDSPRGLYTGAIVGLAPGGDFTANVAIRTLVVNAETGEAEAGFGGGIVVDSEAEAEYEEALLKRSFLNHRPAAVSLIETMRCESGRGIPLIEAHLARLRDSARALGFAFDEAAVRAAIANATATGPAVVRLLLGRDGGATVMTRPPAAPAPAAVRLASARASSTDFWLRHKTTRRGLYDEHHRRAGELGLVDFLFRNEEDELTEGAITNLFLRRGERWWTPAPACGLLPGVMRGVVMRETGAAEARLTVADLAAADEILLTNAVRGRVRVERVEDEAGRTIWNRADRVSRDCFSAPGPSCVVSLR